MKAKTTGAGLVRLRIRILVGSDIGLGPGKAELLRLVRETHSISEAARQMKMSYMRAWTLIRTMNRCFQAPVIRTTRGGHARGGASLTETGEQLLALYEQLETECSVASRTTCKKITALVKKNQRL